AAFAQQVLGHLEAAVLTHHDPRDLVQQGGAGAHDARGEGRVQHGLAVHARRRPAFSIVSVSPCSIAESFCTRWLWPAASTFPSWTSTAPIGTPPSSQLFVACSMARARKRRSSSAVGVQVMGWMLLWSADCSTGVVEGERAAALERCDPGNSPRSLRNVTA